MVVRKTWSATATAYFRRKTHDWIKWANKEHGMMWYQFRKHTNRWLQEAEAAVVALRTTTLIASKQTTPRYTAEDSG